MFHEMNHELKNLNYRIETLVNGQSDLTQVLVREAWQVDVTDSRNIMREKIEDRMEPDLSGGLALSRARSGENLANSVSNFQAAMKGELDAIVRRELCSRLTNPSKHPKLQLSNYVVVPLFDTRSTQD